MNQELTNENAAPVQGVPTSPEGPVETPTNLQPEDHDFAEAVKVASRIRELAPQYHDKNGLSKRSAADAKRLRNELAVEFAVYKAIHVGKGRDGNWGPFITELKFAVRTVDRWIAQKLASGELPEWAKTRLLENKEPEPAPKSKEPIYELVLRFKDEATLSAFAACAQKLGETRLRQIIFEAVTLHEEVQPGFKGKLFLDQEVEPWQTGNADDTLVAQMKEQAAVGVAA